MADVGLLVPVADLKLDRLDDELGCYFCANHHRSRLAVAALIIDDVQFPWERPTLHLYAVCGECALALATPWTVRA